MRLHKPTLVKKKRSNGTALNYRVAFYYTAAIFRFLRQPNKLRRPRALANNGRAAGSGVAVSIFDGDPIINAPSVNLRSEWKMVQAVPEGIALGSLSPQIPSPAKGKPNGLETEEILAKIMPPASVIGVSRLKRNLSTPNASTPVFVVSKNMLLPRPVGIPYILGGSVMLLVVMLIALNSFIMAS